MGAIKKIRSRALPPSSKYFGEEVKNIKEELSSISRRLGVVEHENELLKRKIEEGFELVVSKIDLYANELYKRDNESAFDSRLRLFKNIPEEKGDKRLFQKANAALLKALSVICEQNGLDYWLWSGTVVAAVSRGSAIPWDDDLDICMMRDDFKKLLEILKDEKEYQVSLVYDRLSGNRQYRFVSMDENLFNFIDIVVCDWGGEDNLENEFSYAKAKQALEQEFLSSKEFDYWCKVNYIFSPKSRFTYQPMEFDYEGRNTKEDQKNIPVINERFERAIEDARKDGLLVKNEGATQTVVYGLDNLFNAPKRKNFWCKNIIFPTQKINFEGFEVRVPNLVNEFCEICFEGWPYIPNDIASHAHFDAQRLREPKIHAALEKIIKKLNID